MVDMCSVCQLNTAGEHSWNCPNRPNNLIRFELGEYCPYCIAVGGHGKFCPAQSAATKFELDVHFGLETAYFENKARNTG